MKNAQRHQMECKRIANKKQTNHERKQNETSRSVEQTGMHTILIYYVCTCA